MLNQILWWWIARDSMVDVSKRPNLRFPIAPLPQIVYDDSMTLHLGGKRIELHYFGKGHTSGDTAVYLPNEKVRVKTIADVSARRLRGETEFRGFRGTPGYNQISRIRTRRKGSGRVHVERNRVCPI